MFNELVIIELDKDGAAGWDYETGDIAIDIDVVMGGRIGMSLEGSVDTINELFLIEFICMEISRGIGGIADCEKCMPWYTSHEMNKKWVNKILK